jgi:DNA (cytosine-5)-methyltransferase 1
MGFDARWGVLGAADVGAPHQRDRIWIRGEKKVFDCKKCGYTFETGRITKFGCPKCKSTQPEIIELANTTQLLCDGGNDNAGISVEREEISESGNRGGEENVDNSSSRRYELQEREVRTGRDSSQHTSWWEVEPNVGRVVDGVAARVDRLKAIGNGQVPEVDRTAWEELS